jgi:NhaP-type Na+/H+ or K+/H+ antiporter
MGPHVADIFDPRSWGAHTTQITLEVMRVVLATGLFAIGVELPQNYMAKHAKGLLVMVVPTMAFGWIVVAGAKSVNFWNEPQLMASPLVITHALFPRLSFISSLAIAACLTPTDPIICAAIVGKYSCTGNVLCAFTFCFKGGKFAVKHVPINLRRILSAESAANDGLAYPFLSISMYLTLESSRRAAIGKWFLVGWLCTFIPPSCSQFSYNDSQQIKSSLASSSVRCWVRHLISWFLGMNDIVVFVQVLPFPI